MGSSGAAPPCRVACRPREASSGGGCLQEGLEAIWGILYSEEANGISILAVMHLHRDPEYWQNRLGCTPSLVWEGRAPRVVYRPFGPFCPFRHPGRNAPSLPQLAGWLGGSLDFLSGESVREESEMGELALEVDGVGFVGAATNAQGLVVHERG